ncbi:MAG: nucleotidyltransferase domain-containing protein [Candidatus Omnitrophota bacterium]
MENKIISIDGIKKEMSLDKDVSCVYLFGSFASEKVHSSSDVDIAILLGNKFPEY